MTFNPAIPGVDSTQLQYMKLIDLNNYYRDVPGQEMTYCQVCHTSITKNDVFVHSISKRHKYNKLLFGIAQNRSQNLDADFIVLNIDRLQCRYCDSLKINSDDDDLVNHHIQDIGHISKRQDSLDGNTTSAVNSSPLLKPLDTLIIYANDSKKRSKESNKIINQVDNKKIDSTVQNSIPRSSIALDKKRSQNGKKLPDYISIDKNDTVTCNLCVTMVPNTHQDIDLHVNGKKHKRAMEVETLLIPDCISAVNKGKRNCTICLVKIANNSDSIGSHIDTEQHKKAALQFSESTDKKLENRVPIEKKLLTKSGLPNFMTIQKNGDRRCTLCRTGHALKNSHDVDQHVDSKKHKEAMRIHFKLPDCVTIVKDGVYCCMICNIKLPNVHSCIINHVMTSEAHKKAAMQLTQSTREKLIMKAENIATNNIDKKILPQCSAASSDEKLKSGIALPSCFTIGKNGIYKCTPCGIEVPKTNVNIMEHLNGKKHKQRVIEITECKRQKLKMTPKSDAMPALTSTSKKLEIKGVAPDSRKPEVTSKPTSEPVLISNSRKTKGTMPVITATGNIDQCSLPQLPSGSDSPSCFCIREDGSNECTPCGMKISQVYVTDEINYKEHMDKMMEMNEATCQELKLEEKKTSLLLSVLPGDIPALPHTVETDTYMCITCLISMPNDKVIIKEHNKSPMHKQKNRDLKIDVLNTVYLNGNNSSNYICFIGHHITCKLCKLFLPEHSLITDHVNSEKHRNSIPQTSGPNSSTNPGNSENDVMSKHVDSGLVHIVEIDGVRACKICRKVISTLPDVHVRTNKHQVKMQKVDKQLIGYEKVEKLRVCKFCKKMYPESTEFAHISSNKHIRKTKALS